ncbi:MAG TPA: rhomboid family intramembrane serine protease [Chitinophagaceae bacterium]|nr:rhomboid family intramembrane serine protease [Chitinophagaceae bacterium]
MQLSITLVIIIITVLVSLGGFSNQKLIDDLIFYPPAVSKQRQWYRFFSCGLIHADFSHLLFNMLSLYFFGPAVERAFSYFYMEGGRWIYLLLYTSALLVSLLPTYYKNIENYHYRSLGASGAVSAIIFAGLLLSPGSEVYIFFIPIPIPGFIFAPLYLILSAWMDRKGTGNINHSAHIWGAVYGLAFTLLVGYLSGVNVIQSVIEEIRMYIEVKW